MRTTTRLFVLTVVLATVAALAGQVKADTILRYWKNTATDWNTDANWNGAVQPDSDDVAVFDSAATYQPVLSDDESILSLYFKTPAAGGWTVSTTTGKTLTLGAGYNYGGSIGTQSIYAANTSGTNTISAPITLGASQSWYVASGGTLAVSGAISGGSYGLTKVGGGTLNLSAANGFTGATNVYGGTLTLSGANGVLASTSINIGNDGKLYLDNSTANSNRIPNNATITMNGGTLQTYRGGIGNTETVGDLILSSGRNTITAQASQYQANLAFASLTNDPKATVVFDQAGSTYGTITLGSTTLPNINGIAGGWAIVKTTSSNFDWVAGGSSTVTPLTTYETSNYGSNWTAEKNVQVSATQAIADSVTINSLKLGASATVADGKTLTVTNGIFVQGALRTITAVTNAGAYLCANADATEAPASTKTLYIPSTGQALQLISSGTIATFKSLTIVDKDANHKTAVVLSGSLVYGGKDATQVPLLFSGGLTLAGGTLTFYRADCLGTGDIRIQSAATLSSKVLEGYVTATNPFYWDGDFTYSHDAGNFDLIVNSASSSATTLTGNRTITLKSNNPLTVNSILTWNQSIGDDPDGNGTSNGYGLTLATDGGTAARTLVLGGVNTYTGDTTVRAGTLALTGSGSLASANIIVNSTLDVSGRTGGVLTLASGQRLKGSGTVVGGVVVGGGSFLAPGNSVGTLTVASLSMASGSIFDFEFNTTPANDQTLVTGALTLPVSGNDVLFNLLVENTANAWSTNGTYNLVRYGSLTNTFNADYLAVNNPVSGKLYTFQTAVDGGSNWLQLVIGTAGGVTPHFEDAAFADNATAGGDYNTASLVTLDVDGNSDKRLAGWGSKVLAYSPNPGGDGNPVHLNDATPDPDYYTLARFDAGFNTGGGDVTMQWRSRYAGEVAADGRPLVSDVVSVTGIEAGIAYVLSMEYDEQDEAILDAAHEDALAAAGQIYLVYKSGSGWVNAIDGNSANDGLFANYQGSYSEFVAAHPGLALTDIMGAWGVDTDTHEVWAVLDHTSEFAVVPEPATMAFLAIGGFGMIGAAVRRRRRS